MTEQQQSLALERQEIATRVANFRAIQQKFQREREAYYAATIRTARDAGNQFAGGQLSS